MKGGFRFGVAIAINKILDCPQTCFWLEQVLFLLIFVHKNKMLGHHRFSKQD